MLSHWSFVLLLCRRCTVLIRVCNVALVFSAKWLNNCSLLGLINQAFNTLWSQTSRNWRVSRKQHVHQLRTWTRLHLLPLNPVLPRGFRCSPDFEEPSILPDWQVLFWFLSFCCIWGRACRGWHLLSSCCLSMWCLLGRDSGSIWRFWRGLYPCSRFRGLRGVAYWEIRWCLSLASTDVATE